MVSGNSNTDDDDNEDPGNNICYNGCNVEDEGYLGVLFGIFQISTTLRLLGLSKINKAKA